MIEIQCFYLFKLNLFHSKNLFTSWKYSKSFIQSPLGKNRSWFLVSIFSRYRYLHHLEALLFNKILSGNIFLNSKYKWKRINLPILSIFSFFIRTPESDGFTWRTSRTFSNFAELLASISSEKRRKINTDRVKSFCMLTAGTKNGLRKFLSLIESGLSMKWWNYIEMLEFPRKFQFACSFVKSNESL